MIAPSYKTLIPEVATILQRGLSIGLGRQEIPFLDREVGTPDEDLMNSPSMSGVVAKAHCVLWDTPLFKASMQGHEALTGVVPTAEVFDRPDEIWQFTERLGLKEYSVGYLQNDFGVQYILGIVSCKVGGGLGFYIITYDLDGGFMGFPLGYIKRGEPILTNTLAPCIAAILFMSSKFVRVEENRLNHQARKAYKRMNYDPPTVKTVLLRQSEKKHGVAISETREYSCQWFVGGHWRKLHQPRKADNVEVTYVAPHVKGPAGKPLRVPRQTVYAVNR